MKKKPTAKAHPKPFVLITGLSGSGKDSVLKSFEDLGYHCVDNLPIDLIPKFAEMCQQPGSPSDRAAAVVDIRGGEALSQLPTLYRELTRNKPAALAGFPGSFGQGADAPLRGDSPPSPAGPRSAGTRGHSPGAHAAEADTPARHGGD